MSDLKLSKELVQQALIRLNSLGNLTSRSMFGGYGICCNNTMFAQISDGRIYLRASKISEEYYIKAEMEQLIYRNRGVPVPLSYYCIDEIFWHDEQLLLVLAKRSLADVLVERNNKIQYKSERLKDLPNLGLSVERLLTKAGIHNQEMLFQSGAVNAYLMVKNIYANAKIELMFAFAGAIEGCHVAVLAKSKKEELLSILRHSSKTI